jgi:hypothetical protein
MTTVLVCGDGEFINFAKKFLLANSTKHNFLDYIILGSDDCFQNKKCTMSI